MKTKLDWTNLAVSTDKTRHNLTGAWRYDGYLVGCDGLRLHRTNGLDVVEKPFRLDGEDCSMPSFDGVIPTGSPESFYEIKADKETVTKLRAIAKAVSTVRSKDKIVLESKDGASTLRSVVGAGLSFRYSLEVLGCSGEFTMGIDFHFLCDALDIFTAKHERTAVDLRYFSATSPLEVKHILGSAIIMPCRIEEGGK